MLINPVPNSITEPGSGTYKLGAPLIAAMHQ
jgi:hypothetical protein